MHLRQFLGIGLLLLASHAFSQDPNFHIYLCFGQSNMEGAGTIEAQDRTVNSRFKVMAAVDCSNLGRKKGSWYTAVPPLCRCWNGLSPADYFGRTMVENLPDSIRVGVINVSVGGCKIELFQKENYQAYVSSITEDWLKNIIAEYNGNPYGRLVDMAKLAQKDGVIKGILIHQGESNTGDETWPSKVKGIYGDLMKDLELIADSVPLLAGEVVHANQGGVCSSMNAIIAKLPKALPNSYVISSKDCTDGTDNLHFNSAGYRELGKRYAVKMLALKGYPYTDPNDPKEPPKTESLWFEAERFINKSGSKFKVISDTTASNGKYLLVPSGVQAIATEPTDSSSFVHIPFVVTQDTLYTVFGRLNCPTYSDDSYWVKIENSTFTQCSELKTTGWMWKKLISYPLRKGAHALTIAYREDGTCLDKICISSNAAVPTGMGEPDTLALGAHPARMSKGYSLGQNYPNPFTKKTIIPFEISERAFVSLKIYNLIGVEIVELAGKTYDKGRHALELNAQNLDNGIYFYSLKSGSFSQSRKMLLQGK